MKSLKASFSYRVFELAFRAFCNFNIFFTNSCFDSFSIVCGELGIHDLKSVSRLSLKTLFLGMNSLPNCFRKRFHIWNVVKGDTLVDYNGGNGWLSLTNCAELSMSHHALFGTDIDDRPLENVLLKFRGDFLQYCNCKISQHAPFLFSNNFHHHFLRIHVPISLLQHLHY